MRGDRSLGSTLWSLWLQNTRAAHATVFALRLKAIADLGASVDRGHVPMSFWAVTLDHT